MFLSICLRYCVIIYRNFTDTGYFRTDPNKEVDPVTCESATEETHASLNSGCDVDVVKLCNGVMDCPDCSDEVFETCMDVTCVGSKFTVP